MGSEKNSKVYAGKIEKSGNLIRLSRSTSFFKMLFKVHSNGKFISLFAVFLLRIKMVLSTVSLGAGGKQCKGKKPICVWSETEY